MVKKNLCNLKKFPDNFFTLNLPSNYIYIHMANNHLTSINCLNIFIPYAPHQISWSIGSEFNTIPLPTLENFPDPKH